MIQKKEEFLRGITAAIPIAIGYIPISIAFGVISSQSGIPLTATVLMSVMVFAGASQFMAVNMLAAAAGGVEIVLAAFVLNLRHLIMSMSLMNLLQSVPKTWKAVLSFGITDETFAVAVLKQGESRSELTCFYAAGLFAASYGSWVIGTLAGGLLANAIPQTISSGMSIALYAMFIGLLVPAIRGAWRIGLIAGISMLLGSFFHLFLSGGWPIVLATVLGGLVGVFFSGEES